jgi:hypothetical protein
VPGVRYPTDAPDTVMGSGWRHHSTGCER